MKKIVLFSFLLLAGISGYGQGSLAEGGKQLNAGIGFSNYGAPVYIGLDFGVHESITIGPRVSFRRYNFDFGTSRYNQSLIGLSFNGNYHFNKLLELPKELDIYAGLTVGYYVWTNVDIAGYSANRSGVGVDGQLGVRYFFTDRFGLNVEFGGGYASGGGFGITYKL
jgi:outer membrane immunogenic protein